jgi:hypothetical protein
VVVKATTTTLCSVGRMMAGGTTSTSLYGRHMARERPQGDLAACKPPREPPHQLHVEGEATQTEIDGGALG